MILLSLSQLVTAASQRSGMHLASHLQAGLPGVLTLLNLVAGACTGPAAGALDVWVQPAATGERIGLRSLPPPLGDAARADAAPVPAAAEVRLAAAPGGFARAVVAFRSRSSAALLNVTVSATPLQPVDGSSNGSPCAPSERLPSVRVFQQGYLYTHYHARHRTVPAGHPPVRASTAAAGAPCPFQKKPSGGALPGYLPDALFDMPEQGIKAVPADQTQTVLLELGAPATAAAGSYQAALVLRGTLQHEAPSTMRPQLFFQEELLLHVQARRLPSPPPPYSQLPPAPECAHDGDLHRFARG